jgi:hypothetical protein
VTEEPAPQDKKRPAIPWPIVTAIAGLGIVAAVVLLVGRRPPTPPRWDRPLESVALVQEVHGTVQALRGRERRPLARGDTAYVGESIETEGEAAVSLKTYPGETLLGLGGNSGMSFVSPAEVELVRGRVQATVPDSIVQAFITAHGRIVTRETKLSVAVSPRGTQVEVTDGNARVEGPRGLRQVVQAGATMFLSAEPATSRPGVD